MRKLLISLLLILVIVMTALCIKNGISIGPLQVYGVSQIKALNNGLNAKIDEANGANASYTGSLSKLKKDISSLIATKEECLNKINLSTESQLEDATQTKNYTIEYLWSKIGNHATKEGVVIRFDVVSGTVEGYKTLNFKVTGNYLSITNFITALENDSTLEFTIDNFQMNKGEATFTVKDVKIKQEQTTSGLQAGASAGNTTTSTGQTGNSQTQNTVNNTNTVNNSVTTTNTVR